MQQIYVVTVGCASLQTETSLLASVDRLHCCQSSKRVGFVMFQKNTRADYLKEETNLANTRSTPLFN